MPRGIRNEPSATPCGTEPGGCSERAPRDCETPEDRSPTRAYGTCGGTPYGTMMREDSFSAAG